MDKATLEAVLEALEKRRDEELQLIKENTGKSGFYDYDQMEGIMDDVAIDEIHSLIEQL